MGKCSFMEKMGPRRMWKTQMKMKSVALARNQWLKAGCNQMNQNQMNQNQMNQSSMNPSQAGNQSNWPREPSQVMWMLLALDEDRELSLGSIRQLVLMCRRGEGPGGHESKQHQIRQKHVQPKTNSFMNESFENILNPT